METKIRHTASDKGSWTILPTEVRLMILEAALQSGCKLANLAAVSREWQTVIERHNFASIKLTQARLAEFQSMVYHKRILVRYIWLCIELEEYDCSRCAPDDNDLISATENDNFSVTKALQDLFTTLSKWGADTDVALDINIYSPSDSKHWFKHITFEPDTEHAPSMRSQGHCIEQEPEAEVVDTQHIQTHNGQPRVPEAAFYKVFDEILSTGPFDTEEEEIKWWRQLPQVPVVTSLLIRLQNRRRWNPKTLEKLFTCLPRLLEIHYEPWREWDTWQQELTDKCEYRFLLAEAGWPYQIFCHRRKRLIQLLILDSKSFFESLFNRDLKKLVLFENFNNSQLRCIQLSDLVRVAAANVCRAVAKASLQLECLAVSFIADASPIFEACQPSWVWPKLESVVLTSRLLTPDGNPEAIDHLLQNAAGVATRMPNLVTMEIWNGREALAALFRYEAPRRRQAMLTWRATWIQPPPVACGSCVGESCKEV